MNIFEDDHQRIVRGDGPVKYTQQYVASISVTLFLLVGGTVLGWTSPTIPILTAENSTLPITPNDETWIGSLMPFGAVLGTIPAGTSANVFGRKKSMFAVTILLLLSWTILAAARSVEYIFIGRLISGFALGWGMTIQPMYIGEMASPKIRGAIGVIGQIHICFGFLIVFSIGPFVSYLTLCLICQTIVILAIASFYFMPETPFYLVLKNDIEEAKRVIIKLRNSSEEDVDEELRLLQLDVELTLRAKGKWTELFTQNGNRKAVIILLWLVTLQQFNGVNAVLFYSQSIFEKSVSGLSGSASTIIIGIIMTCSSLIVPYLVETVGRRPLIVQTSLVMGIAHACLALYFCLHSNGFDVSSFSYVPLITLMVVIASNSMGIGPVPWVMVSELLSPSIRAYGSALTSATSWFMTFVVTKLFQTTEDAIGISATFMCFAVVCFIGATVNHIFIPETKGKSLPEIQAILNS